MKKVDFTIVNIVASAKIPAIINLYDLAFESNENIEYEPEQFPGAILRMIIDGKNISVLIFENGKINITGAKKEETIQKALEKTLKIIKNYIREGQIPKDVTYKITNRVATTNLGHKIDIERLSKEVENVEYDPDVFPGAKMRYPKPDNKDKYISLLIFSTGKINCAGAKDNETIQKILDQAYEVIKDYFID